MACNEKTVLMFCRDGNRKTYEVHRMQGVSGLIDWILYLQRRKHPTPKHLPSTLGRQRTQGNKQSLFEWVLLRMYTKQKMREQKKNMLWIAICISPQNRKLISMLAYIVIAEVTFFNWKKQTKFILGIILLCQFIEWHTEYHGSKMFFCDLWWWRNWQWGPTACGCECQRRLYSFNEFHMNICVQYMGLKE